MNIIFKFHSLNLPDLHLDPVLYRARPVHPHGELCVRPGLAQPHGVAGVHEDTAPAVLAGGWMNE